MKNIKHQELKERHDSRGIKSNPGAWKAAWDEILLKFPYILGQAYGEGGEKQLQKMEQEISDIIQYKKSKTQDCKKYQDWAMAWIHIMNQLGIIFNHAFKEGGQELIQKMIDDLLILVPKEIEIKGV